MVFRKSPASKGGKGWLMPTLYESILGKCNKQNYYIESTQSILSKSSEATRNTATAMKYFAK
jgi:hypothetical protein